MTIEYNTQSFCNIICVAFADIQVTHSSTLERRLPVHLHPQPAAPTPSLLTQQDVDSEMVEILIWKQDKTTQNSVWLNQQLKETFHWDIYHTQPLGDDMIHNKARMFVC